MVTFAFLSLSVSALAQQDEKSEKRQKTYTRKYYKGGEKYRSMEAPKYYDRKGRDEDAEISGRVGRREEKYRRVADSEGAKPSEKQLMRDKREDEPVDENTRQSSEPAKTDDSKMKQEKYKQMPYEEKDGRSRRDARRSARREKWENSDRSKNQ